MWTGLYGEAYKLVELKAPVGYNTNDTVYTAYRSDVVKGINTTTITNKSGYTLPKTGGIGVTVLYIVGIVLVLVAGGALLMRKPWKKKS